MAKRKSKRADPVSGTPETNHRPAGKGRSKKTGGGRVLGLRAIKAEGGITFAEHEASAKYAGMPHATIAFAAELANIAPHPLVARVPAGRAPEALPAEGDSITHGFADIGTWTYAVSGHQIPAGLPQGPMVVMQIEAVDTANAGGDTPA